MVCELETLRKKGKQIQEMKKVEEALERADTAETPVRDTEEGNETLGQNNMTYGTY